MKGLIKKFVWLTLILQLFSVQIVKGQTSGQTRELIFGDLLKFERKSSCLGPAYSHYAVYVGLAPLEGKKPDEDIFEMTKADGVTGCRFSKLQERPIIYNYLDKTLKAESQEEIKKTVVKMAKDCGKWTFKNTCEHVATHVRHGEANRQCNQPGTLMEPVCKLANMFMSFFRGRRSKYLRPTAAAAAAA